jgi:hypothetical protein
MDSMTTCWACETELRPEWKFCIQCGVPVETDAKSDAGSGDRMPSPLALFGWIIAAIAGVLAIIAVVISLTAQ